MLKKNLKKLFMTIFVCFFFYGYISREMWEKEAIFLGTIKNLKFRVMAR